MVSSCWLGFHPPLCFGKTPSARRIPARRGKGVRGTGALSATHPCGDGRRCGSHFIASSLHSSPFVPLPFAPGLFVPPLPVPFSATNFRRSRSWGEWADGQGRG